MNQRQLIVRCFLIIVMVFFSMLPLLKAQENPVKVHPQLGRIAAYHAIIHEDALWIGRSKRSFRLDGSDRAIDLRLPVDLDEWCVDPDGDLLMLTKSGVVFQQNGTGNNTLILKLKCFNPGVEATAIAADRNYLYIATEDQGLLVAYRHDTAIVLRYNLQSSNLNTNEIIDVAIYKNTVYLATDEGIFYLKRAFGPWQKFLRQIFKTHVPNKLKRLDITGADTVNLTFIKQERQLFAPSELAAFALGPNEQFYCASKRKIWTKKNNRTWSRVRTVKKCRFKPKKDLTDFLVDNKERIWMLYRDALVRHTVGELKDETVFSVRYFSPYFPKDFAAIDNLKPTDIVEDHQNNKIWITSHFGTYFLDRDFKFHELTGTNAVGLVDSSNSIRRFDGICVKTLDDQVKQDQKSIPTGSKSNFQFIFGESTYIELEGEKKKGYTHGHRFDQKLKECLAEAKNHHIPNGSNYLYIYTDFNFQNRNFKSVYKVIRQSQRCKKVQLKIRHFDFESDSGVVDRRILKMLRLSKSKGNLIQFRCERPTDDKDNADIDIDDEAENPTPKRKKHRRSERVKKPKKSRKGNPLFVDPGPKKINKKDQRKRKKNQRKRKRGRDQGFSAIDDLKSPY